MKLSRRHTATSLILAGAIGTQSLLMGCQTMEEVGDWAERNLEWIVGPIAGALTYVALTEGANVDPKTALLISAGVGLAVGYITYETMKDVEEKPATQTQAKDVAKQRDERIKNLSVGELNVVTADDAKLAVKLDDQFQTSPTHTKFAIYDYKNNKMDRTESGELVIYEVSNQELAKLKSLKDEQERAKTAKAKKELSPVVVKQPKKTTTQPPTNNQDVDKPDVDKPDVDKPDGDGPVVTETDKPEEVDSEKVKFGKLGSEKVIFKL